MAQTSFTPLPGQKSFLPPEGPEVAPSAAELLAAKPKITRPPIEFVDLSEPDPIQVAALHAKLCSWELRELLEKRGITEQPTELQAKLLVARGITPDTLYEFLDIDLEKLPRVHDQEKPLKNAGEAQRQILNAVLKGQTIYEFSDYDVDGLTSGSTFVLALRSLSKKVEQLKTECDSITELIESLERDLPNAQPALDAIRENDLDELSKIPWEQVGEVTLHIQAAKRFQHGFGINSDAIAEAIEKDADLVIVGDCGMPTEEQRALLAEHEMKLIVIDHHMIHGDLPENALLINPRQPGCDFADGLLSTVGIEALILRDLVDVKTEQEILALAGLGGHCDVMPAFGLNRILAYHSLQHFRKNPSPWIQALLDRVGYGTVQVTADTLGFTIGPVINALGRMTDDTLSMVKFITAETFEEAEEYVDRIVGYNVQRKTLEQELLRIGLSTFDFDKPAVIGSFHRQSELDGQPVKGVIGIIAGLLMRKFGRMSLVYARDVENVITASGRSPDHIHITDLLQNTHEELLDRKQKGFLSHGGHEAAAGCKNEQESLPRIKDIVNRELRATETPPVTVPYHVVLNLEDVTYQTYKETHELFVPWGHRCPAPAVLIQGVRIEEIIDKNGYNLMIRIRQGEEVRIARWFKESPFLEHIKDHPLKEGAFVDIVGTIHLERNNGKVSSRIYIDEILPAGESEWFRLEGVAERKLGAKMNRELLPSRLHYSPPEKETSQTLGSRRVKKLDGFTKKSVKGKQTPLDKALAERAEHERMVEEARAAFESPESEILSETPSDISDQATDDQPIENFLFSFDDDAAGQEESEQDTAFSGGGLTFEDEIEDEEPEPIGPSNYLFPELDLPQESEPVNAEPIPIVDPTSTTEAPHLEDSSFSWNELGDAEPWEVVTLHNHRNIVIPQSVAEHYKRHPALFVRQENIGYRVPQTLALTFLTESTKLIAEEANSTRIAEYHKHLPQYLVESDMNTGKTCLALRAMAPYLEQPGSIFFVAHIEANAAQIKKEALKYLRLKEDDITIITGEVPLRERQALCEKQSKLYIVTAGAYYNCLRDGFVPETMKHNAITYDEVQNLKGDTNHVKLHRELARNWITDETFILGMSGTIEDIDEMLERFFPQGLIYEVPSQMKLVDLRDQPVELPIENLRRLNTLQRKMLPLIGEISEILAPISIPDDELEALENAEPRRARAQKRKKKSKNLIFDWQERFEKIARFTKKDGTMRVSSYGEFAGYLADYTDALSEYKKNPRMNHRIAERMGEGLKWLLAFNEINHLINTESSSERFAVLNYAMPIYWSLLHKGVGSEHKSQHYEELVYGDPDIRASFEALAEGTLYTRLFEWDYQQLSDFVAESRKLPFASADDTYNEFFRLAEEDYIQKLIRGEIHNGPKTALVPELLSNHLSTDATAKAYVFVQFTSTARLLTKYINGLDLGFEAISAIGKQGLRAHEKTIQDKDFERFKVRGGDVRVAIGTDVLKVGRHVDDSNIAIYFNLDPREQEFLQSLARLRSENPIAYLLATNLCGPDMPYLGINRGIYTRRRDKFRKMREELE